MEMENKARYEKDLNLEATELTLGLPGTKEATPSLKMSNKRALPDMNEESGSGNSSSVSDEEKSDRETAPARKTQVVGWPPVRSYRKSCFQAKKPEGEAGGIYVKVSMYGAPYLRKIDLKGYKGYPELLKGLEDMFKFSVGRYSKREGYINGSEYAPTYEDTDGDWMLLGDVPWE